MSEGSDLASTLVRRAVGRHDNRKDNPIILRKSFNGTGFAFISAKICGVNWTLITITPILTTLIRTAY